MTTLLGRESETRLLNDLLDRLPGSGSALVVTGGPGIGKSALLNAAAGLARDRRMSVLKATGVQSEALLPFAGLHLLLRPVLDRVDRLAPPHRDALLAAFGLTDAAVPDPFLTALAALNLLAEAALPAPVAVIADDAHWLDRASCDVLTFIARRLEFEPIVLVVAIRDGFESPFREAGLAAASLDALPDAAAAALLDARAPGLPATIRARVLTEAAGNPLALVELPIAREQAGGNQGPPGWLPLTTRLERAFAARAFDLPPVTRTALLVAALNDSPLLSEVLAATALLAGPGVTLDALTPAISAQLVEVSEDEVRFRHPLMRKAIRQNAGLPLRHAAHAALAGILAAQPERRVWHRAASTVGPDEAVARELETAAAQAQRRGAAVVSVPALHRAATLGDRRLRTGRLLRAAELAFELGQQDLVQDLLAQADRRDRDPRDEARVTWIRESFADGIPGSASGAGSAGSLVQVAEKASTDGDTDLALKLLYGAAIRCWWVDPGQATRDQIIAAAERVDVAEDDPRLLIVLGYAAPVDRGSAVIDGLARLRLAAEPDAAAARLAGSAAMAVGAFDQAAVLLGQAAATLRTQGRLGLLARALALQAYSAAQLVDLGAAVPAAAEARRLGAETRQPLITATAEAVEALLAGLQGDTAAAGRLASRAEQTALPVGARAVLAAAQLARGVAALGDGRPAEALGHLRRIHDPSDLAYHYGVRCATTAVLAEAALRSGQQESIAPLMAELEDAARRTTSPSLHAGLRYARALLADDRSAERLFEVALRAAEAWPFLRARTQLAYGEWLHQHRRNAASRAPLRAARDACDALGVIPWSERARQQLRATGEASRPRTPQARDQLTPQELQIVQLAAGGLSNREIAERLYLSHRTVSSHLYRVFPKLGVTSRAELRAALDR